MPLSDAQIQANLQKKFGSKSARTGGRCTMRRKFKAQSKSASQDDKRLNSQLKKLSVTQIPAIEEVNLFKDDNTVVHFTKPRVQAEIQSNTYVVSGECATKKLEDLFPHILPQLGVEHMDVLKNFASTLGAKADLSNIGTDDAVPELIDDDFEQVANADAAAPKAENAEAASASAPSASAPAVEAVAAAAPAAASSEDNKEQSGAAEEKKEVQQPENAEKAESAPSAEKPADKSASADAQDQKAEPPTKAALEPDDRQAVDV